MGNAFQAALGRRGCGLGKQWGLKFVNLLSGCLVYVHGQPENIGAYFNWIARVFQAAFAIWGDLFCLRRCGRNLQQLENGGIGRW